MVERRRRVIIMKLIMQKSAEVENEMMRYIMRGGMKKKVCYE